MSRLDKNQPRLSTPTPTQILCRVRWRGENQDMSYRVVYLWQEFGLIEMWMFRKNVGGPTALSSLNVVTARTITSDPACTVFIVAY